MQVISKQIIKNKPMAKLTSRKMLSVNNRKLKREVKQLKAEIKLFDHEKSIQFVDFLTRLKFAYKLIFKKSLNENI